MMPVSAEAAYIDETKTGFVLGQAQRAATKMFINDVQIPTMSFNGKIIVLTKDLKNFGFVANWDSDLRDLTIRRDLKITKFAKVKDTTSTKLVDVTHTDILVFLDNRMVPTFYVDNGTAIYADDLFRYGSISYDTKKRTAIDVIQVFH